MSELPQSLFLVPRGVPQRLIEASEDPMLAARLAAEFAEITHQRRYPPSKDAVISAMWAEYVPALVAYPEFEKINREYVSKRPVLLHPNDQAGVPRSELVGQLRMGLQDDALQHSLPLHRHGRPEWRANFAELAGDKERLEWLRFITSFHPPTTNKERYGPLEVVRQMAAIACQEVFHLWEGGSSVQIGVKATQLKHLHPFKEPLVRRPVRAMREGARQRLVEDREGAQAYAALLGRPALQGEIVCTDLYPEGNDLQKRLFRAAQRPSEISDEGYMATMQHLMNAKLPNIRFVEGDITDAHIMSRIARACSDIELHFAFLGTMLNQVGQEHVEQTIANALNLLHNGGVLLILEFAAVDPDNAGKLHLTTGWRDWTYRLFAIHKNDDKRRVHELMRFKNSRMEEVQISNGLLDLGDGRGALPMRQQMVDAAAKA